MSNIFPSLIRTLAVVLALLCGASALTVRVTDRDLQGLLAYGESEGGKLTLQVAQDAGGPVKVWLIDDGQITTYSGSLQGGQINLEGAPAPTLAKVLAGRGLTLSISVVGTVKGRSFSLPGLRDGGDSGDSANNTVKDTVNGPGKNLKDGAKTKP